MEYVTLQGATNLSCSRIGLGTWAIGGWMWGGSDEQRLWVLDQCGAQMALWGARSPEQLEPLDDVMGWTLDDEAKQTIDAIVRKHVTDPVGPEFMAPPARTARTAGAAVLRRTA